MQIRRRASAHTLVRLCIVLLLCLSSVVGVSYALFTSDLEDGTIGINVTSGQVDVDLVNTSGNSLVGDVLHLSPNGKELSTFLFEPGVTVYTEGFRVVNKGTVPVNFRMYISRDDNVDALAFEQAFEIFITKDVSNLESGEGLMSFKDSLALDASTDVYYLVIRMKETADNTFQNVVYTGVGVTVYAVQGNVAITD